MKLFDKFRENDAIGNPITYDYGKYGRFSPTTLRYIKVASDIKRMIGDVSGMRIVEIGGGYGGQCKILADAMGFATYTIIDLEKCLPLIEKFLDLQQVSGVQCLASNDVAAVGPCDLVISNYAFSEVDGVGQREYIKYVIEGAPYGYMTLNFISGGLNSLTLAEIEELLLQSNHQSRVFCEEPNTHYQNVILTWQPRFDASEVSQQSSRCVQKGNAVTNGGGGGRLGDQLLGYFHAKWVAYKYGLPFILTPFPMCEEFCLSERDATLTPNHCFQHYTTISNIEQVETTSQSTLYTVPYFSEYLFEYACGARAFFGIDHFQVDWDDPGFREEVVACLQPKRAVATYKPETDGVSIAVHVRRGGGVDPVGVHNWFPLKFPPDSYYIKYITFIAEMNKDKKIYVRIFTDDLNPVALVEKYRKKIPNKKIEFSCRKRNTGPHNKVIEDFLSFQNFDCLIIPQSNFSIVASKMGKHAVVITPTNAIRVADKFVIDEVEIQLKSR